MTMQTRFVRVRSVRADGTPKDPTVVVQPLTYNVIDSYDTIWEPGVFTDSIGERKPQFCFSHDWTEPIGRMTDYQDGPDSPTMQFRLDDFDDVPTAKRIYSQIKSGTLDEYSVGFDPQKWEEEEVEGYQYPIIRFLRADLDEVSSVLRGAVPGTKTLDVRRPSGLVERQFVVDLATRLDAGEIDLPAALRELAHGVPAVRTPTQRKAPPEPAVDLALDADVSEALALLEAI